MVRHGRAIRSGGWCRSPILVELVDLLLRQQLRYRHGVYSGIQNRALLLLLCISSEAVDREETFDRGGAGREELLGDYVGFRTTHWLAVP